MKAILATIALSACSPWEDIGDPPLFDEDPGLGTIVLHGSRLRGEHFTASFQADGLYVAISDAAGVTDDLEDRPAEQHVYRIDPATQDVTELPALAFTGTTFLLPTAQGALVVSNEDGVGIFDGSAWTTLPRLPNPMATFGQVVALDAAHVVTTTGVRTEIYTWAGTQWVAGTDLGGAAIGPVAPSGIRLALASTSGIRTNLYSWTDLSPIGTEASLATPEDPSTVKLRPNGTIDEFQLGFGPADQELSGLATFSGGALQLGDPFPPITSLQAAFGSTRVIGFDAPLDGTTVPEAHVIEGGHVGALMLTGGPAHIDCACDRTTDTTCACVPHDVLILPAIDPTASTVAFVTLSDLSGHREYYLRIEPLPFTAPFPP